jgi:hypothetical protein
MDFDDFFIIHCFSLLLDLPFASHQCAEAHRWKIAGISTQTI